MIIPMIIPIIIWLFLLFQRFSNCAISPHPNAAFHLRPRPRTPGRDIAISSRQSLAQDVFRQPLGEWERNMLSGKKQLIEYIIQYMMIIYL